MGIAELNAHVYANHEGQAQLAEDIMDVLNSEKLDHAKMLIKIRKMCRTAIREFGAYNR